MSPLTPSMVPVVTDWVTSSVIACLSPFVIRRPPICHRQWQIVRLIVAVRGKRQGARKLAGSALQDPSGPRLSPHMARVGRHHHHGEETHMHEDAVYTDEQRRKPDIRGLHVDRCDWVHPAVSNGAGGMCVEVADVPGGVVVRDSAVPDALLAFSPAEFDVFLNAVKRGEFDRFTVLADRA